MKDSKADGKCVIPVMFPPFEDEALDGWLSRLAAANGMTMQKFRNAYLPARKGKRIWDTQGSSDVYFFEGLYWKQKEVYGFPDAGRLVMRHTVLPLLAGNVDTLGITIVETAKKAQAVLYNCDLPGYDVRFSSSGNERKICRDCIAGDTDSGRAPYMRVWHQLPGVKACAVHGTPLIRVNSSDFGRMKGEPVVEVTEEDLAFARKFYEAYRKGEEEKQVSGSPVNGVTPVSKQGNLFIRAACCTCGERFLTTVYALAKGRGCPVCERRRAEEGSSADGTTECGDF